MAVKHFRELIVWQKAHRWVLNIYIMTKYFPREELFGLTTQLRKAAVSVPANIAEGFTRRGTNDKARFFNIAHASLEECRYYLILAQDLNLGDCSKLLVEVEVISKMLGSYYAKLLSV